MPTRLFLLSVLVTLIGVQRAAALDAVTYSGTIGALPIILELTAPAKDGARAGRYAYLAKGADIPLHGAAQTDGSLNLEEEKPCTKELCRDAADTLIDTAPIAAVWSLTSAPDGTRLSGTWRDKETGKTLPVVLEQKGKRTVSDDNSDMLDVFDTSGLDSSNDPAALLDPPVYDLLKMARPLKQGAPTALGANIFRMDEDSRIGVEYPTIIKLAGGDPAPLNAYLAYRRQQFEEPAFRCLSRAYLGFGWTGYTGEGSTGYDSATIEIQHLSPRLMQIVENGSYWCGGAHPDNFMELHLADARTGKPLAAESLLRGWSAADSNGEPADPAKVGDPTQLVYTPSEDLIAYVSDHRLKFDADTENDCQIDDLVGSNLTVYFKKNSLVFTLKDLPSAIAACNHDLLEIPLKRARPLLTEAGARYFAALER
jgi:hypothetical protein